MDLNWIDSSRPSDTYVPINHAIIGSDNGLSPVRHQVFIWTNAGGFIAIFTQENEIENIFWKMVSSLFWPHFVRHNETETWAELRMT